MEVVSEFGARCTRVTRAVRNFWRTLTPSCVSEQSVEAADLPGDRPLDRTDTTRGGPSDILAGAESRTYNTGNDDNRRMVRLCSYRGPTPSAPEIDMSMDSEVTFTPVSPAVSTPEPSVPPVDSFRVDVDATPSTPIGQPPPRYSPCGWLPVYEDVFGSGHEAPPSYDSVWE